MAPQPLSFPQREHNDPPPSPRSWANHSNWWVGCSLRLNVSVYLFVCGLFFGGKLLSSTIKAVGDCLPSPGSGRKVGREGGRGIFFMEGAREERGNHILNMIPRVSDSNLSSVWWGAGRHHQTGCWMGNCGLYSSAHQVWPGTSGPRGTGGMIDSDLSI